MATYAQKVVTSVGKQLDKLDSLLAKSEAKENATAEEENHVLQAADALLSTARPLANATQVLHTKIDPAWGGNSMGKREKENIDPHEDFHAIADTQIDPASEDMKDSQSCDLDDVQVIGYKNPAKATSAFPVDVAAISKDMKIHPEKKPGLNSPVPRVKETICKEDDQQEKLEKKSTAKSEEPKGGNEMQLEKKPDVAEAPQKPKIPKAGPKAKTRSLKIPKAGLKAKAQGPKKGKDGKDDSKASTGDAVTNPMTGPAETSEANTPKAKRKVSPKIHKAESKKNAKKDQKHTTKPKKTAEPKDKSKRKIRDLKTEDDVAAKMHSASWPAICLGVNRSFISFCNIESCPSYVFSIFTTEVYSTAWKKAKTLGKDGPDRKQYAQDARKM